jgi:hypothetical protein
MLGRKLVRDLRRQRGQVLAVLAVIALGVMLFVASAAAYVDLCHAIMNSTELLFVD